MEEGVVTFKSHEFKLRPETETLLPTLAFKLPNGMSHDNGLSLCREFMSTLSWVDSSSLEEEIVLGGGMPINAGKSPNWRSIRVDRLHIRYLPEVDDPRGKLALALYREAHNVNSVPYKFLGFFKIMNILLKTRKDHSTWINANLVKVEGTEAKKINDLLGSLHDDVGKYLYES